MKRSILLILSLGVLGCATEVHQSQPIPENPTTFVGYDRYGYPIERLIDDSLGVACYRTYESISCVKIK